MPGDMAVALGACTVDRHTLFAHSSARPSRQLPQLLLTPGRSFAAGEMVAPALPLPQVRQTCTVLGSQPAGEWGFEHGVNEYGVAVGRTSHQTKLQSPGPCLTGADLVRLALERAHSAAQAVELLTGLIERHGQGRYTGGPAGAGDSVLLVADGKEAFLIEAAGMHWVVQELQQVRAVSDVGIVRQDWNRISRGLAGHVIEQGWWPCDGSKLDFAGSLSADPIGLASALRRWGRATVMLEQQSGHIDLAFLRRLLADHYEMTSSEIDPFRLGSGPTPICQHGHGGGTWTASSLVASLGSDGNRLAPAWCAFGPPCIAVFFPIFLEGDLPLGYGRSLWEGMQNLNEHLQQAQHRLPVCHEALARVQARMDQETEEFIADRSALKQAGSRDELQRQATYFMQHNLEQFQMLLEGMMRITIRIPARSGAAT